MQQGNLIGWKLGLSTPGVARLGKKLQMPAKERIFRIQNVPFLVYCVFDHLLLYFQQPQKNAARAFYVNKNSTRSSLEYEIRQDEQSG